MPATRELTAPATAPPARLRLKAGPSRGLLDGAWWPRSPDLARELPALTAEVDEVWGRVLRVAVNPLHWPDTPARVRGGGHLVKLGWFADELDPEKILLLSYGTGRLDLLVVPPDTGREAAERLMSAAASGTGPEHTASDLVLGEERASTAGHVRPARRTAAAPHPSLAVQVWESEGGLWRTSPAP